MPRTPPRAGKKPSAAAWVPRRALRPGKLVRLDALDAVLQRLQRRRVPRLAVDILELLDSLVLRVRPDRYRCFEVLGGARLVPHARAHRRAHIEIARRVGLACVRWHRLA